MFVAVVINESGGNEVLLVEATNREEAAERLANHLVVDGDNPREETLDEIAKGTILLYQSAEKVGMVTRTDLCR